MIRRSRLLAGVLAAATVLTVSSCAAINVDALPQPGPSYDDGYDVVMQFSSVLNRSSLSLRSDNNCPAIFWAR